MPNQRSFSNRSASSTKRSGSTKKRPPVFPKRLHDMLENAERDGYSHVISWMPDGKSFKIHIDGSVDGEDEKTIVAILKRTFNQTRFKSFLRQLQLYGFERTYKGPHRGECKHELFIRGRRELLDKKSIEDFQRKANDASNRRPKTVKNIFETIPPPREVKSTFALKGNPIYRAFALPSTFSSLPSSRNRYSETSVIPTKLTNLILSDSDSSVQPDSHKSDTYDDDDLSLVYGNPLASVRPIFESKHLRSIDMVRECDDVISIHSGENVPYWTGMELEILRHAL